MGQGAQVGMESIALVPALVVDDEPVVQRRLAGVLRGIDPAADIACAGSLAEARVLLAERDFALVLADLGLPDGNGCELVAWLHAHRPETTVLVVSAWSEEEMVLAALRAGAVGYLLKEREDIELAYSLRSVQRGGAPIDPMIARRILELMPQAPASVPASPPDLDIETALLSEREYEILAGVERGLSNREIAAATGLSRLTIETHTRNIYRKLAVHSRTEAVHAARTRGLLQ